ncbi:MAG TPA: lipoyl synthase [Gemmatimonadota bacterium]|nr:lipoyl synthase [Gemmatimonadota bacterium]
MTTVARPRKPEWLKVRAGGGPRYASVKHAVEERGLHTVCQEARCPNIGECWGHGTATFMILGDICTRGCRYCAVDKGMPTELDLDEPAKLADAVVEMGLSYVVITSVDRDDLADGGASIFAGSIRAIRDRSPGTEIEVLVPDFQGGPAALRAVLDAGPDVLNHNVETVPRLYRRARGGGVYAVTLELLERARAWAPGMVTKTGMMLGLGEEIPEVLAVMRDLVERGVDILTLGQYLRPTEWHLPVARFVHPDEFAELARHGEAMGFAHVEAGPLVRSSYRADRQLLASRRSRGEPAATRAGTARAS